MIFYCYYSQAESHGTRFINDLKSAVSKQIAFDAIIRVRTSTGKVPHEIINRK